MVEHFFRHASGRLLASLVRLFGPHNLHVAEDVVQEALVRALYTWSISGVPANPAAWITRVAKNLALDTMRHARLPVTKEPEILAYLEQTVPDAAADDSRFDHEIRDDLLRMMFVCCHPLLPQHTQVVCTLKVLCGFSTVEIARAFLASEAAVDKQLTRARQRLREAHVPFEMPMGDALAARLDGVLETLYLLFTQN